MGDSLKVIKLAG